MSAASAASAVPGGSVPLHVVACAHGTDNLRGRRLIDALRADLDAVLTERSATGHATDGYTVDGYAVRVHEAYVDVQEPRLGEVLAGLPAGERAIVAPLLLSEGVHTSMDIAQAVAAREHTVAAAPLGPDPMLAEVLAERLAEAGYLPGDAVVLASAGTRVAAGQQQAQLVAGHLAELLGHPVSVGYGAAAAPSVPQAVAAARADGAERVGIAAFLLAPGFFHDKLSAAGADYVTAALLPSVTIAKCVAGRLEEALPGTFADAE